MGIVLEGHGATFDVDYAKFWEKQSGQESSPVLPADVKTVAGRAVELVIKPTPCGDIKVPATLGVKDEKVTQPMWAEVKVDRAPPTKTRFLLDLPGAKEVKIGSYTATAHDLELKAVMLYEIGCAPLAITVDGKPLAAQVVDGTVAGEDIAPRRSSSRITRSWSSSRRRRSI